MTPERMADLVARWVRFYTRGLPAPIAERRAGEIEADLHDHVTHERARGARDPRIAVGILSRMVRGMAADASWRSHHASATTGHSSASEHTMNRTAYRRAVGLAVAAILVMVWLIGAVGIIADSGDGADLMYGAVLGIGVVGALAARFRPRGMSLTLLAMAATQVVVAAIALVAGMVPSYNSPLEILALNGFFAALFIGSAWLFRRAASQRPPTGAGPAA